MLRNSMGQLMASSIWTSESNDLYSISSPTNDFKRMLLAAADLLFFVIKMADSLDNSIALR